ncbi:300 kDa antigen AG231 [Anastrepha obliqua]|uniref:300 kDa antigen AG231 n=1 Tax=Anastrepha obliqua TaxID=95512 RepID=UPI00240992EB|nr:300 kDa antigen AG231 [Anastrepha obliqua]
MSLKLFGLAILSIILYTTVPTQAGVIHPEKLIESPATEPQTIASDLPESRTISVNVTSDTPSRYEDSTLRNAVASLDPAPGTIEGIEITLDTVEDKQEEPKPKKDEEKQSVDEQNTEETEESNIVANENKDESAINRDEATNTKVNADESDSLASDTPPSNAQSATQTQKSSKLLLLSTPRIRREQEENIAEPEDVDINTAVSTDETTELSIEIRAKDEKSSEESVENDKKVATEEPSFFTRVSEAIFGKKSADEPAKPAKDNKEEEAQKQSDAVEQEDKKEIKKDDDIVIPAAAEQTPETHNDNSGTAVLIETEPEYVLIDSDVEHLEHIGSFTHADSAEHLQPIVHSVEVVPSHFEEPLLFTSSYVHAW